IYDTLYHPITDNSGVSVSLEGTSFKTSSDASGKWNLANVPPGTYTLTFSKDRYATSKDQTLQFTGNGTLYYSPGSYTAIFPIPNLFPDIVVRPFQDLVLVTTKDSVYVSASFDHTE